MLVELTSYKLLHLRRDNTLGPLFINRKQIIPIGVWLTAENHPTKGYAVRPGWHVLPQPVAPHLSTKNRIWCVVQVRDVIATIKRPESQGGQWWLANEMKVIEIIEKGSEVCHILPF